MLDVKVQDLRDLVRDGRPDHTQLQFRLVLNISML